MNPGKPPGVVPGKPPGGFWFACTCIIEPSDIESSVRSRRSGFSRGGHALRGQFLALKGLKTDRSGQPPARQASVSGVAPCGYDPDCQRCALSSALSGIRPRCPRWPMSLRSSATRRYARLKTRCAGLSLANALAVGVFDADTCGRRLLLDLSAGREGSAYGASISIFRPE